MQKKIFGLIVFLLASISQVESFEIPFIWSYKHFSSKYIRVRHTEGKGLGYHQGYTSLDRFFAQPFGNISPFTDFRGHLFNDKRFAGNAGIGLRWFSPSCNRIWGFNFFYDSFRTWHQRYYQLSFGYEILSDTWELHLNGYVPINRKKTDIYTLSYNFVPEFQAKARQQFAMQGADLELGYHFCACRQLDVYAGLGPYYYWGRSKKVQNAFNPATRDIVGGRLRAMAKFCTCCEVEGVTTYDSRFHWTGQITFSLNFPLDWLFPSVLDQSTSCIPQERLFQRVVRNEMMVIDRITRRSSNPAILDPEFQP